MGLSAVFRLSNYFFFVCLGFLLTGCASYRVKPLRKLTKETAQYCQEKDEVQVCASRLTKTEFKEYTNGAYFPKKCELETVLMTVYNKSSYAIIMDAHDIQLSLLSAQKVIEIINCVSGPGALFAFFGSFFGMSGAGSLLIFTAHGCAGMGQVLIGLGLWLWALPVAIVAAIATECHDGMVFKELLLADLQEKILSKTEVCAGQCMTMLIIAPREELVKPFVWRIPNAPDVPEKVREFTLNLGEQPCV